MKRNRTSRFQRDITWILLLLVLTFTVVGPTSPARASDDAQNGVVTASAIAVPAQITQMGFLISGSVKEVLVSEGEAVDTGQSLIVLNTPDLEYAVIAAEAAYKSAAGNAEIQRYKRVKVVEKGKEKWEVVHPEVRQLADTQALQAQIAWEIAKATLEQNGLTAPFDGTVTSIEVMPGEFVGQGQAVITLATLDNMLIETTDLSERDILKVKVGDPASVFVDSLNETINGRVIRITPRAEDRGGDIIFKVTIALDEQPKGLLWGMTAEVRIGE
ncbi:MAG: efflux RND transporter periplasmic adaptor subunit [Anaerolineales bacterium]|nr:efflux RND transporter periplasmic adaptor subunit [Anaerolineales bacterium]